MYKFSYSAFVDCNSSTCEVKFLFLFFAITLRIPTIVCLAMLLLLSLFILLNCRQILAKTDVSQASVQPVLYSCGYWRVPDYQITSSLCEQYVSKAHRPNGPHCYLFTDTILFCGVVDRPNGLYQINTNSNYDSYAATRGKGDPDDGPYEVQCSSILTYLDRLGAWENPYVKEQELWKMHILATALTREYAFWSI